MFVGRRDLKAAKGRFALMGGVIVLMTLLVTVISGLASGLARENISAVTGLPADRLAFADPGGGAEVSFTASRVPETTWEQWSRVPGVTRAEPLGITMTRAQHGDKASAFAAFGVPAGSGLAPAAVADGRTVLSEAAADELGARPGDTVTLPGGRALTVAAVAGDAMYSHAPVIWTSIGDWQAATGGAGQATVVALDVAAGADLRAADDALGTRTVSTGHAVEAISSYTAEQTSLNFMRGALLVISALVVGAFFTVWTIQRSGDIAVLKALGAPTGWVLRDALAQALAVLVGGIATGVVLALIAGEIVGSRVPFSLDLGTIALPAAAMTVLGVLGAGLALVRVTTVDPLTALGSNR